MRGWAAEPRELSRRWGGGQGREAGCQARRLPPQVAVVCRRRALHAHRRSQQASAHRAQHDGDAVGASSPPAPGPQAPSNKPPHGPGQAWHPPTECSMMETLLARGSGMTLTTAAGRSPRRALPPPELAGVAARESRSCREGGRVGVVLRV